MTDVVDRSAFSGELCQVNAPLSLFQRWYLDKKALASSVMSNVKYSPDYKRYRGSVLNLRSRSGRHSLDRPSCTRHPYFLELKCEVIRFTRRRVRGSFKAGSVKVRVLLSCLRAKRASVDNFLRQHVNTSLGWTLYGKLSGEHIPVTEKRAGRLSTFELRRVIPRGS